VHGVDAVDALSAIGLGVDAPDEPVAVARMHPPLTFNALDLDSLGVELSSVRSASVTPRFTTCTSCGVARALLKQPPDLAVERPEAAPQHERVGCARRLRWDRAAAA
jgi:hypothetical protein